MCKALLEELDRRIGAIETMKRPKWEDDKAELALLKDIRERAARIEAARPKIKRKKRKTTNKAAARGGRGGAHHATAPS